MTMVVAYGAAPFAGAAFKISGRSGRLQAQQGARSDAADAGPAPAPEARRALAVLPLTGDLLARGVDALGCSFFHSLRVTEKASISCSNSFLQFGQAAPDGCRHATSSWVPLELALQHGALDLNSAHA